MPELAAQLSSCRETLDSHADFKTLTRAAGGVEPQGYEAVFLACALSASGLAKLFGPAEVRKFGDSAFRTGLAASSISLGDPADGRGSAAQWLVGGARPVDLLLVVAGDDLERVTARTEQMQQWAAGNGLELVCIDHGRERGGTAHGHEHFGFKDGVSMLGLRGRSSATAFLEPRSQARDYSGGADLPFASPGRPLVWPGQVLFGYPPSNAQDPAQPDPAAAAVVPDWASNGSYLVYRRLRQDVMAFNNFLENSAADLNRRGWTPALTRDSLGALLVGRWQSGTPVTLSQGQDAAPPVAINDFGFAVEHDVDTANGPVRLAVDAQGRTCPLAAHIRKVNPRDGINDIGGAGPAMSKLILRRGIAYENGQEPDDDRGLLFLALHSSIRKGFEFLMQKWVNQPNRPNSGAGQDPLLASGPADSITLRNGEERFALTLPGGWITPTGGEYFFVPPIRFFSQGGPAPA